MEIWDCEQQDVANGMNKRKTGNPVQIISEYVKKLDALGATGHDPEGDHIDADMLLLSALEELGFAHLSDAWKRVQERCGTFWYA
jgi:hypothetical protein